jgi:hypothetical protein
LKLASYLQHAARVAWVSARRYAWKQGLTLASGFLCPPFRPVFSPRRFQFIRPTVHLFLFSCTTKSDTHTKQHAN